jgi:hypothetical protein
MKILSKEPYLSGLPLETELRVRRSLESQEHGFDVDLVTPLVPDKKHPTEGRIAQIDRVGQFLLPTGYEWLDMAEEEQKLKIGPYSITAPYALRKSQVYSFFEYHKVSYSGEALDYASNQVSSLLSGVKLHSVSVETAFSDMPKGTNLGAPFFSSDYEEYGRAVLEMARAVIRRKFSDKEIEPCLLYRRGQPRGLTEDPKDRTVWGYSHIYTILELMLQIPMLHALRKRPEFAVWINQNAVDEAVTVILDEASSDVLSVDFSGFDASVPFLLINRVFDIIRGWFSSREVSLIDFVERVFTTTGLLTPEGILTDRNGGVPSGSGLTNLIDSLVQLLAFHYFAFLTHNDVEMSIVQGDDGVHSFRKRWSLEDVQEIFENLGLKVSSDKGGVSSAMVFFTQNVHHKEYRKDGICVGIRPMYKALNGMLSYERFHKKWNSYDDSIRWRQQLQACSRHPAFRKAVRWLYDSDRFSKLTLSQLVKEAKGKEMVESALDIKPFPYGKPSLEELEHSAVEYELMRIRYEEQHPQMRR